jgi:hypothetical protein
MTDLEVSLWHCLGLSKEEEERERGRMPRAGDRCGSGGDNISIEGK